MSRTFSTLTLGLLVALSGCPSGDDSSTSTSVAGSSTGAPATTGDTGPGTTAADTTSAMSGSTTDTPGTSGASTGVDECGMCVESMCADQLAACDADPDCTCFQDCAEMNPGIPGALQCGMDCGVDPLDVMTVTGALAACTQMNCPVCLQ